MNSVVNRPGIKSSVLLCSTLTALLFGTPVLADNHVVLVRDGSVQALVTAMQQAFTRPPSEPTELVLSGKFRFQPGQAIPAIEYSDITLRSGAPAAVFTATEGWEGPLFDVGANARLRLTNLEFADIELLPDELIRNRGELAISGVQFRNTIGSVFCLSRHCPQLPGRIITNLGSAHLTLDGVSFVTSGVGGNGFFAGALVANEGEASLRNVQVYLPAFLRMPLFVNSGVMDIVSGSFYTREWVYPMSFLTPGGGITTMANSIVVGFPPDWCEHVESQGHNLIDAAGCGFDAEADLIGIDAELIFAPVQANWNAQSREPLTDALVPLADSPAVDSGGGEYCTGGSLLGPSRVALDGDGDGVAGCDRGAVEREPSILSKGGINGLYYNPESDGHYLYIAETTYTTMVMWTTFDSQGKQAWIFGIGGAVSPNGRLVTDAYINRNGSVSLDGALAPANAIPWGSLEVRMSSCNRGRLLYDSNLPGFGSGEFPLRRLASVDQQVCVDDS